MTEHAKKVRHGSLVPVRWRITVWCMLTTSVLLALILVTAHNVLMRDVDVRVNNTITQEAEEFSAFVAEFTDPTDARPFESLERLMEEYSNRQVTGFGEVILGVVDDSVVGQSKGVVPESLTRDAALLRSLVAAQDSAGSADTSEGHMRWGRVVVDDGGRDATMVVAVFTDPSRQLVNRTVSAMAIVGAAGVLSTTGVVHLVAGRVFASLRMSNTGTAETGRLQMLDTAENPGFVVRGPVDASRLVLDIESKVRAIGNREWILTEVAEGQCEVDAQRVTQAMIELAANAIGHTTVDSRIELGSRFEGFGSGRHLSMWITDDGPGVRPEDAPVIFEHGRDSDSCRMGEPRLPGTGRGLAIVRAVADGHGGSAWVRSTPGEGATFGLNLPVADQPARENI